MPDDRVLFDVAYGPPGYFAVGIAHRRGLFRLLEGKGLTAQEAAEALGLTARAADALLVVCASLGLLDVDDGLYGLTGVGRAYLLESSPTYWGPLLELCTESGWVFGAVELAAASGERQDVVTDFATFEEEADRARQFTRAMHSLSVGPAGVWPDLVDLSGSRTLLDVGGGSGAHALGACRRWPDLRAVVLDQPPVCDVAEELVSQAGLADRISAQRADLWTDPFATADVHFYSNVLHDWPPEKCRFLLEKSFAALEPGGRILVHEALLHDDRGGPFAVAAFAVVMLVATEGQQLSGRELTGLLERAGFRDVGITPAAYPYSLVEARKPG